MAEPPAKPPAELQGLMRSISTPSSSSRRCSYCQKILLFKAYRCRQCRYKCHRKCATSGANGLRRNSSSFGRTYPTEEHWTKVLQANEVNSNVTLPLWLRAHARTCPHRLECVSISSASSRSSSISKESAGGQTSFFGSLYSRFRRWVDSSKQRAANNQSSRPSTRNNSTTSAEPDNSYSSRSSGLNGFDASVLSSQTSSVLSEKNELCWSWGGTPNLIYSASGDPLVNYQYVLGDSGAADLQHPTGYQLAVTGNASVANLKHLNVPAMFFRPVSPPRVHHVSGHRGHVQTTGCLLGGPEASIAPPLWDPSKTWPPLARRNPTAMQMERVGSLESALSLSTLHNSALTISSQSRSGGGGVGGAGGGARGGGGHFSDESLRDITIDWADLEILDLKRQGRRCTIYSGKWHGEVMIHKFDRSVGEVDAFVQRVKGLSMLRHENLLLFMGASFKFPNLAIVTSVRKGRSLFEQIHFSGEQFSMRRRVAAVRQTAQGLGYLHAKGVAMGKLNSKNVYMEPKATLCLLDYGMPERKYDREGYGFLPRGQLTYVAPEILSRLRVEPPRLVYDGPATPEADVYAFGTLLYELTSNSFPFRGLEPECLVWRVVSGERQDLKKLQCHKTLLHTISRCWSQRAAERPTFEQINRDLQLNNSLHKKHSSSDPQKIHRCADFIC